MRSWFTVGWKVKIRWKSGQPGSMIFLVPDDSRNEFQKYEMEIIFTKK